MRKILSSIPNRYTEIFVLDEPGQGGACHEYAVQGKSGGVFANISFQNGPVKEFGVNGCHQEDLLAIVIHRLESFQAGDYACEENAKALEACRDAMEWLNHRTVERQNRGVEGTNIK